MKNLTNKYLSYYQIIGIVITMVVISIWTINEGRMMPFYILFVGLLFLPFIVVSMVSLLDISSYKIVIQKTIYFGISFLIAGSFSSIFFFEWGGVIISLISSSIGICILKNRNELENQILIFNIIGALLLTIILIVLLRSLIN